MKLANTLAELEEVRLCIFAFWFNNSETILVDCGLLVIQEFKKCKIVQLKLKYL